MTIAGFLTTLNWVFLVIISDFKPSLAQSARLITYKIDVECFNRGGAMEDSLASCKQGHLPADSFDLCGLHNTLEH